MSSQFICHMCGVIFNKKFNLTRHYTNIHKARDVDSVDNKRLMDDSTIVDDTPTIIDASPIQDIKEETNVNMVVVSPNEKKKIFIKSKGTLSDSSANSESIAEKKKKSVGTQCNETTRNKLLATLDVYEGSKNSFLLIVDNLNGAKFVDTMDIVKSDMFD